MTMAAAADAWVVTMTERVRVSSSAVAILAAVATDNTSRRKNH